MSFLICAPSVFVIGEEYEILVNAKENGILHIVLTLYHIAHNLSRG